MTPTPQHSLPNGSFPRPDKSRALLRTAAGGSAVAVAGSIIGRILSLILQVMICRMLAPAYYGLFTTGLILCQVLRHPFSLGLQKGSLRFMAMSLERKDYPPIPAIVTLATIIPILVGSLGGAGIYLLSGWMSETWFHDSGLTPVLQTLSLGLPFFSLMMVTSELTRSFKTTKYSVLIEEVVFPAIQIGLFLALFRMGFAFQSVLYSFVVASVVSAGYALWVVTGQMRREMVGVWSLPFFLGNAVQPSFWKEILRYSLPLMPAGITLVGFHFSDILLLNVFMDAHNVGLYAGAAKIALLFAALIRTTNIVFAPLIATQYGVQDTSHIELLYKSLTRWMFYVALPMLVFVLIARVPMIGMLGADFSEQAALVLAILAIGHVYVVFTGSAGLILTMTAHPYKELWTVLGGLILNVVLNIVLIPRYGLLGAATAATTSRIVINSVRIFIVYRIFKIHPWSRTFTGPLCVGFGALCIDAIVSHSIHLGYVAAVTMGAVGAVAVCACILITGLAPDDRLLLTRVRQKFSGRRSGPPPGMNPPPITINDEVL